MILLFLNCFLFMSQEPQTSSPLMPYAEVRKLFSEGRQQQLLAQGPITDQAIQMIRQSRKYVPSPRLRTKTA